MSRYIDANAYAAEMKQRQDACKEIMDAAKEDENWEVYDRMGAMFSIFVEAKLTLDAMPTVDAVPVVRCRECRWACLAPQRQTATCMKKRLPFTHDYDYFCADGERGSDD